VRIKNTCGIYCIYNLLRKRYYIGKSKKIRYRLNRHISELRNNIHCNKYLQSDWNKCKEISFIFIIIEECTEETLTASEQIWLDRLYDNQNYCYNIQSKSDSNLGVKRTGKQLKKARILYKSRMKKFTVVSPKGETLNSIGIRKFCRKRKLPESAFNDMLNGKIPSVHGWRLPENINIQTGRTNPKKFKIKLVSPDGRIYKNIFNLEVFARKHNLHASSIRHLIAGRIKSTLGWTLHGRDSRKNMKSGKNHHYSKSCIVNNKLYDSVTEAEKVNNIAKGLLGRALRNNQKKYKDYEISWYIEGCV
jgi:group I intron endonuclease